MISRKASYIVKTKNSLAFKTIFYLDIVKKFREKEGERIGKEEENTTIKTKAVTYLDDFSMRLKRTNFREYSET